MICWGDRTAPGFRRRYGYCTAVTPHPKALKHHQNLNQRTAKVYDNQISLRRYQPEASKNIQQKKDLTTLFDNEVEEIKELLAPGTRRKMDAVARAQSLAVLERSFGGGVDRRHWGRLSSEEKEA